MTGLMKKIQIPMKIIIILLIFEKFLKSKKVSCVFLNKLNVTLKEIMPQNFVDEDVKVFDDEIAYKLPLLCGGNSVYNARITKLSNSEVIYDSKS